MRILYQLILNFITTYLHWYNIYIYKKYICGNRCYCHERDHKRCYWLYAEETDGKWETLERESPFSQSQPFKLYHQSVLSLCLYRRTKALLFIYHYLEDIRRRKKSHCSAFSYNVHHSVYQSISFCFLVYEYIST